MPEHDPHTATRSNLLLALIVGVIVIIGASIYHARHTKAFVDATTHQPERFTELYFSNPSKIPAIVAPNEKLPTTFTVHNVEAHDMTYAYAVTFVANGKTLAQQDANFNLSDNGTRTITSNITIPSFSGKGEVQVTLTNLGQSIHFWVITR